MKLTTISKWNKEKGVAGLNIFLSLIAMLFMIGVLVMAFVLASSKLRDSIYDEESGSRYNLTIGNVNNTVKSFLHSSDVGLFRIDCSGVSFTNNTGTTIAAGNYTVADCTVVATENVASHFNQTDWNVTYTYAYDVNNEATDVINETSIAIGGATDWFSTFIVLGAIVVLVLLVVIIINSIKQTEMGRGA